MQKNGLTKKGIALGIILFFIGTSAVPVINGSLNTNTKDVKDVVVSDELEEIIDNTASTTVEKIDRNCGDHPRDAILYVGGGGPGNYTTIQDAIDNASTNDTIYVYPGIYVENIMVDKTLTLIGDEKLTTIIDGGGQYDVIHICAMAHRVTITGFTIQNSGSIVGAGFDVGLEIHSQNNNITNNIFTHHFNMAIELFSSNTNTITHNLFTTINRTGLDIMSSCDNIVSQNTFINIGEKCILLDWMGNSFNNNISYNIFSGNFQAIVAFQSENIIQHNDFINNTNHARAHYDIIRLKKSRNYWNDNYWDDWRGYGPKYIRGFLGLLNLNFDWHPASEPHNQRGFL